MKLLKHQSIIFTLATLCLFASSISLNQAFAVDNNTDFNISVDPTLEITIPDSVNLLINPSAEGTIADTSFDITVGTNNLTGYTLTMYNDSSNLTSTDSSAIIPTLEGEIAKSNFPVNHWGYSLDDNTYKPITTATSGTVLKTTETTSAADTTTINLATKVDLDKPAGIYTNTFVFSITANYVPEPEDRTLADIETMQEINSQICANTPTPESTYEWDTPKYELTDTRDNKTYTVAKLLDGNCWMLQNLALGYPYDEPDMKPIDFPILTPEDSDVSEDFEYDGGHSFYVEDNYWEEYFDEPVSAHWENMEDAMRYGNFYNWYLATAGSGYELENDDDIAPHSICPKGWRLPTYNFSHEEQSGEFDNLASTYGDEEETRIYQYILYSSIDEPSALNFSFPGAYIDGNRRQEGIEHWWSNAFYENTTLNLQAVNEGDEEYQQIRITTSVNRYEETTSQSHPFFGKSIRCVAR